MAQQTAVEFFHEKTWELKMLLEKQQISVDEYGVAYYDILEAAKQMEREQRKDDITDYNIKVTEFLLNPLFNLEHSKHGIACEKLADIRNEFIKKL